MDNSAKRFIRLVWNGPFHIGKLSPRVSVGDVLLKMLETAWRLILTVVGLLLLIGLSLVAWIYVVEPIFFPPLKDQIRATASYDDGSAPPPIQINSNGSEAQEPFRCNPDFPLKIAFANGSSVPVGRVGFSIEGFAAGRSRNLVQYGGWLEDDAIIPPGYTSRGCWAISVEEGIDPAQLTYTIEVYSAEESENWDRDFEAQTNALPTAAPSDPTPTETPPAAPAAETRLSLATLRESDWDKIGMGCSCSFTVGTPREEKLIAGGDDLTFFRLNEKEYLCPAPDTQAMFDGAVSMSCGAAAVQVSPFGAVEPGFDGHSSNARLNIVSPEGSLQMSGTWGCGC